MGKALLLSVALTLLAAGCSASAEARIARHLERAEQQFSAGEFVPAAEEWGKAAEIAQSLGPRANASLGSAYAGIGWAALETGQVDVAEGYFGRAVEAKRAAGETRTIEYGRIQGGLAYALERRGDIQGAVRWARGAVQTQTESGGTDRAAALANAQHQLARLLHTSGQWASSPEVQGEAARLYARVLAFQRSVLGEDSPDIVPYLHELEGFLVDLHQSPEMQEVRVEAETILQRAGFNFRSRLRD